MKKTYLKIPVYNYLCWRSLVHHEHLNILLIADGIIIISKQFCESCTILVPFLCSFLLLIAYIFIICLFCFASYNLRKTRSILRDWCNRESFKKYICSKLYDFWLIPDLLQLYSSSYYPFPLLCLCDLYSRFMWPDPLISSVKVNRSCPKYTIIFYHVS